MRQFLVLLSSIIAIQGFGQKLFAEQCIGIWKGTMQLYAKSSLVDSVPVIMTLKRQSDTAWIWRTEYVSDKMPMVKDYVLRLKDRRSQIYITDEGNGVELLAFLYDNRLIGIFETEGVLLTSSYQINQQNLIFEVTAGKKTEGLQKEVENYTISSYQKVILNRQQ